MIEFLTNPVVEILGPDLVMLRGDFVVKCYEHYIFVPDGFVSDLDSVPRLPFVYTLFKNRAPRSAVLHDWLYSRAELSRKQCDDIYMCAMIQEGVPGWMRHAMYRGVRLGGAKRYGVKD